MARGCEGALVLAGAAVTGAVVFLSLTALVFAAVVAVLLVSVFAALVSGLAAGVGVA